jgi:periplasmic divalent cation tolerance protein
LAENFESVDYTVVMLTVDSERQAQVLARKIVSERLAACVQIQKVQSFYRWEDRLEQTEEHLLIAKTRRCLFVELTRLIEAHHSYQTPEIIQIPITGGSKKYLQWIDEGTK